jgi:hypothetical protein
MEMGATPTDEDYEPTIAPLGHDEGETWLCANRAVMMLAPTVGMG